MSRRRRVPAIPASAPAGRDRTAIWLAGLLFLLPLAIYGRCVGFGFIGLDDSAYVTECPEVQAGLMPESMAWAFTTFRTGNWIPLTWLSLMLDSSLFGVRPGGYHLTNVLLHAANTVLLFIALVRGTGMATRSAFAAAVFALHPLHVESVAWISERKDVLSIFFGLFALWFYVEWARRNQRRWLAASFAFFVLSLMSKQTLVTLPFVFFLLDDWPLRRTEKGLGSFEIARLILEKLPFLALAAVFSAIAVIAQKQGHTVQSLEAIPLATRFTNALFAYVLYLWQTFVPNCLAVFYPYVAADRTPINIGISALLLIAITVVAVAGRTRWPYLLAGWLWFLGTLVPMIGLVQVGYQQRADRYMYFPQIGLSLAVTWLVGDLFQESRFRRPALRALAIGVPALLAGLTFSQIGYWRNSVTLFRHAQACTADNAFLRYVLGTALLKAGDRQAGVESLEAAAQMNPDDIEVQYNLANGLKSIGRWDEAAEHYRAALALNDRLVDAYNNLGLILMQRGDYAEAKRQFSRMLEIDPNQLRALVNLGELSLKTKEYPQAIEYSRRALAINKGLINAHLCMAIALREEGRIDQSLALLQHLSSVAPSDEQIQQELARTVERQRALASPLPQQGALPTR